MKGRQCAHVWLGKRPARHRCGACRLYVYCGRQCAVDHWTRGGHRTACIGLGGPPGDMTLLTSMITLGDEAGVKEQLARMQRGGLDGSLIPVELAPTESMVNLLLENGGADAYRYLGRGRVALDVLSRRMPIRAFLAEARECPPGTAGCNASPLVDSVLASKRDFYSLCDFTLYDRAKAAVNEKRDKDAWKGRKATSGHSRRVEVADVTAFRHFLYHGFEYVSDETDEQFHTSLEHLFMRRYNVETLAYWTGFHTTDLDRIRGFQAVTVKNLTDRAARNPSSLMLLIAGQSHLVYPISRRAVATMDQFKLPGSRTLKKRPPMPYSGPGVLEPSRGNDWLLPVTRYAPAPTSGLFFQSSCDASKGGYCGTFYYLEPESDTFLAFQRGLVAYTKESALKFIRTGDPGELHDQGPDGRKYWYTPLEYQRDFGECPLGDVEYSVAADAPGRIQMDRDYYTGIVQGHYADEDDYDQDLCVEAQAAGYDVVVLLSMVGRRHIVSEVLDTRDREDSFESLRFLQP